MTGFSEERRVINARDAGITEFLVKPFNTRDLYKRLYQIIEKPRQFVRCEEFFGPDRRRRSSSNYDGPGRRATDRRDRGDRDDFKGNNNRRTGQDRRGPMGDRRKGDRRSTGDDDIVIQADDVPYTDNEKQ